jgi:hypothetical protein
MTPISPPSRFNPAIWPALEEVIITALAAKPNARFQSVAAFAAALWWAGELAGTDAAVTAKASARVDSPRRVRRSQELLVTSETIADASTIPVLTVVRSEGSARSLEARWRTRGSRQRWIATAGAVALLAITLLGGGSLAAMTILQRAFGSGRPDPSTGASLGGVFAATVTASAAALVTQATGSTATPGQTTAAQTMTPPQPTATSVPGAPMQISPMPLVLLPTQADPETCLAAQRITNTANKVVGWAWEAPIMQGSLHFRLNGQQVNSPPMDPGLAPSGQDTLTITADCTSPSQSAGIVVKDTLGTSYTFELTVQ